ncbi:hypothetical protein Plec18167_007311 [Paecilomyces lecythidis]|uniref:Purine-cytosine permease n=1 Tax=Paecilomyces lecythidis TaxID=3004212 RepID=A0ABR3X5N1_9EURO
MTAVNKALPLFVEPVLSPTSEETEGGGSPDGIKDYDSWTWKIVRYLHAEETGVERITDDKRTSQHPWEVGLIFFAPNFVYLGVSTGVSGITAYGLTFWDAVLCIVFFNIFTYVVVAYIGTFGPLFGMRQMVVSRFWVGYQVMRFFSALNACICTGWAILNLVAGANLLHALGHGVLPPWSAILIMIVCGLVVTLLGYKVIYAIDRWVWIPILIIMLIVISRIKLSGSFSAGTISGTGSAQAGTILSYGAALFGSASSWTLYMCDYTAYQKKTVSRIRLFWSIYFALLIGQLFLQITGAAAAACMTNNPTYQKLYNDLGAGGLMYALLVQDSLGRFGEFCIVVLALGLTTGNIPSLYSAALSVQAVSSKFRSVPRFYWALFVNAVAFGISVACFYKFTEVMDNFMSMLSYFTSLYIGIILSEHWIYRTYLGGGYNMDDYAIPQRLPVSYAAAFAFCCGAAGAAVGMSQAWYTGPIAKLVDQQFPGDLGFELSFAFAFTGHAMTRWIELRYMGR